MREPIIQLRKMPFVRFLISYLIGIGFGYHINPQYAVYLSLIVIMTLCLGLFFGIIIYNQLKSYKLYSCLSFIFYLFVLALGWILMWRKHPDIQPLHFSRQQAQALIGSIDDVPKLTDRTLRFPLKISHRILDGQKFKSTGNLLVSIKLDSLLRSRLSEFTYGSEFIVPADYSIINPPYNPNEFDYRSYLANHLIWHRIYLSSDSVLQLNVERGNVLIAKALYCRQKLVDKLNQSLESKRVIAIVSALVLGYRSQLENEVLQTFSITGTIHVLAVSGLHVGIIFVAFSLLVSWVKGRKWRVIKVLILILLIWLYALLTGLAPSVLRASIMISFGIIALNFARKRNIYNTIAASAFFLLLYNPHYITEIGFKLSYLAVWGIVVLYPKLNTIVVIKNKVLAKIWSYAMLSVAAQVATFPLVLYYFHFFPVYFLPANILIIPPISIIVYLGLLVLVIPHGIVNDWISWVLENLVLIMYKVLNLFEKLPHATLGNIWIEPWHYILQYLLLLSLASFFFVKNKLAIYIVFGCLLLFLSARAVDKIKSYSTDEVRVYNINRNMAIGFFDRDGAVILTDSLEENSKQVSYSIAPNLNATVRSGDVKFLKLGDSYQMNGLMLENNIIQFGDKRLLIYYQEQLFKDFISVDVLYIRNNSKVNLRSLGENIRFKQILLDASNHDWFIDKVKDEAAIIDVPVYVLKNNFAYVW